VITVTLTVYGATAAELTEHAEAALRAFFDGVESYEHRIDARAIMMNDGSVLHYEAEVSGRLA